MSLIACGGGGGGGGPTGNTDTRYSVYRMVVTVDSQDATLELTITETPSKALVEATGIKNGTYVLVIIAGATTYTSAGTASASGNNVTLKPTNTTTDEPFTITINSATNIVIPANTRIKVGAFDKTFTTQTTPDTKGPFDLTAAELNLPNGTSATSFASELEKKWKIADGSTTEWFYPLTQLGTTFGATPDLKCQSTNPGGMPIRFYINSANNLVLYGVSGNNTGKLRIRYDLVVVRVSDGKGWFQTGTDKLAPMGLSPNGSTFVEDSQISLTALTGGSITTKAQLGTTYAIYAIVRYVGSAGDLNSSEGNQNVIKIYPDPENK